MGSYAKPISEVNLDHDSILIFKAAMQVSLDLEVLYFSSLNHRRIPWTNLDLHIEVPTKNSR